MHVCIVYMFICGIYERIFMYISLSVNIFFYVYICISMYERIYIYHFIPSRYGLNFTNTFVSRRICHEKTHEY